MNKQNRITILSISAIAISIITLALQLFVFAKQKPNPDTEYRNMINTSLHNFSAPLPDELTWCGEKVPLDNVFVREALDRELTSIMYQHGTTFAILKRSFRFFDQIEDLLSQAGGHDDLKYLAVAESSLSDVVSPAKAAGFWQFMPTTAKEYGLQVTNQWDERYHLPKATAAAVKYLTASKNRLGSWFLAAAAYNCGESGLRKRMNEQNCKNYWGLHLNSETSRYVYRILAYKCIMENPQDYGFYLRRKDCHQKLEYVYTTVDSTITDMPSFAAKLGCEYKYFRMLNPCLRADRLDNKNKHKYTFRTPTKESFSYKHLISEVPNREDFITTCR